MAYSRWSVCDWYTYWCIHPSDSVETRDNAIFEICTVGKFTAKQLRDDMQACIDEAMNRTNHEFDDKILRECMMHFLVDVDMKYHQDECPATQHPAAAN